MSNKSSELLKGLAPMKVIDMSKQSSAKAYLSRPPEDTHSAVELEAVHRAIRFTQMFKQEESLAKMDEEELVQRPVPRI
jgi:hypothetical protein